MRARKIDANLPEIRRYAEDLGFLVHTTNADWDLTVQMDGKTELWEIKGTRPRVTERQKRLNELGFVIYTITNLEDVRDALRRMVR